MNVADYILKFLISKNVNNVFLITGGAIAFVIDAFSRNKKIKYTCVAKAPTAPIVASCVASARWRFKATATRRRSRIHVIKANRVAAPVAGVAFQLERRRQSDMLPEIQIIEQ